MTAAITRLELLDAVQVEWPTGPRLSLIEGADAARRFGETLAADLLDFRSGALPWADVDPGCLLYGPPGTGKTTLARAIAARCGVAFIPTSYAEWALGTEGGNEVISRIRAAFEAARFHAPCILFIDEIDSFPRRGYGAHNAGYFTSLSNTLLTEIGSSAGVVVIAACNDPSVLDPALLRSGRLDQKIEVPLPGPAALPGIFRYHLEDAASQISELERLALLCVGRSGADIARIVRSARRIARSGKASLGDAHLEQAILTEIASLPPEQLRIIAVHEAGHAAILYRMQPEAELVVSLASATTVSPVPAQSAFYTRSDVEEQLVGLLAGRAAEEVLLGAVSGGAGGSEHSDLAKASALARDAIARRGLSSRGQLAWYGHPACTGVSDARCGEEAEAWLASAYAIAMKRIADDDLFVALLAGALLQRGVLTLREITALERSIGRFRKEHTKEEMLVALGFDPVLNVASPGKRRRTAKI